MDLRAQDFRRVSTPPGTESLARERLALTSFITLVQDSEAKVGFQQLVETSQAVRALRSSPTDAELIARYEGEFVPRDVRLAVVAAAELDDTLANVRRGSARQSVQSLGLAGERLIAHLGRNFDQGTLPIEATFAPRYAAAVHDRAACLESGFFNREVLSGRESIKKIEYAVRLAELGGVVTESLLRDNDAGQLEGILARRQKEHRAGMGATLATVEGFGAVAVTHLVEYARRLRGEVGVRACSRDLEILAGYLESPNLAHP